MVVDDEQLDLFARHLLVGLAARRHPVDGACRKRAAREIARSYHARRYGRPGAFGALQNEHSGRLFDRRGGPTLRANEHRRGGRHDHDDSRAPPARRALPDPPTVASAALIVLLLAGLLGVALLLLAGTPATRSLRSSAMNAVAGMDGYRAFLARRDGAPDLRLHTLAAREALFATLAASPLRSQAAIDGDAYRRNLRRRRPERGLDERVLWLLATAKANQAERFGVGLSELYGRVPSADDDPVRVHLHLQETLPHAHARRRGRDLRSARAPAAAAVLHARLHSTAWSCAPPRVGAAAQSASAKMAGCVLFSALRDRGVALFADEPAVAERIAQLYDEILADEISHVGYIAAQLGPLGLH